MNKLSEKIKLFLQEDHDINEYRDFIRELSKDVEEIKTDLGLALFIETEVPFRYKEILDIEEEDLTQELFDYAIDYLHNNSDILFDYDRIDDNLMNLMELYKQEQKKED